MPASEEEKIIKQYQPLIRALIPYEQQNRLLEGINKFSKRLPSSVRKVVKDEVVRLSSLTDAPADNSAFAQFPVLKFKHFGVQMRLDKVGAQILKSESALYQERYTVGVFESVMNSEYYQSHIKKEQFKKIVDAFSVESQSLSDIHFGEDIAIAPNFPVSSPEFEKGRNCTISSLAFTTMAVETKRPPTSSSGDIVTFNFPEVKGFTSKPTPITYELEAVKFNKHTGKYESHFKISDETDRRLLMQMRKYIESASYQLPLKRELELERAMQDLERDRVLENSPWLPVFVSSGRRGFKPVISLLTKVNSSFNDAYGTLRRLSFKRSFNQIMDEVLKYGESFVFFGKIQTKKGEMELAVTHRQLLENNQLSAVIYLLVKAGEFVCMQCRGDVIDTDDKKKAFAIHDLISTEYPHLGELTHLLFCKDVTQYVDKLTLGEKCQFLPIPKHFLKDKDKWNISYVMEEELDRRSESRYVVEKEASIKLGLLKTLPAVVNDLSSKGLKISIESNWQGELGDEIRVSIPEFKMKNEKYKVVNFDRTNGIIRLCLPEVKKKAPHSMETLLETNNAFFKQRDIATIQRNTHRFIWELAVRHMPSVSIICIANRYLLDRLKTVYQHDSSEDLYPFLQSGNEVPLHGFFADKDATKPKSRLLDELFRGEKSNTIVTHCVRKSDKKLVFVKERDLMYSTLRNQIQNHLTEQKIELCVSEINAIRCQSDMTPLSKKRLAQLSKVDKTMYEKLTGLQSAYTHVLYVSSISSLQNAIIMAKLRPVKPVKEKEPEKDTA